MATNGIEKVFPKSKRHHLARYIGLKLATAGLPRFQKASSEFLELTEELVRNHQELNRRLGNVQSPIGDRIQSFLDAHLADVAAGKGVPKLPARRLVLDRPGVAGELSIPAEGHSFQNELIESYRVRNGVLHNPKSDRRTTQGVFHVAEGGLPVPPDKKAVPKNTYLELLRAALVPPADLLALPYHFGQQEVAHTFVTLLLRPVVCPEVPGISAKKTMEILFIAPGGLVSNLDFVESIFGNGGDPALPENDAALDAEHWTGTTGCVILAPHLIRLTKKELGLPRWQDATERQRREGMCWRDPSELYNNGSAFKVTCRTAQGVMVTLIADNYFGYCKKEVKTQISYSANLIGNCEEEHAGGALAFPRYNMGDRFQPDSVLNKRGHTLKRNLELYPGMMEYHAEGYAIDRRFSDILYTPEDAIFDLAKLSATWKRHDGGKGELRLTPGVTYVHPSGYKIHLEKHPAAPSWRFIGTVAEGTFCHKPCTVSGGGKSEISKSIMDSADHGPIFMANYTEDMDAVQRIFDRSYADRFKDKLQKKEPSRTILSTKRSLGSVIKLLTPSPEYTAEYNEWLASIPDHVKALVFTVKRFYRPDWGDNWRQYFGTDLVNGEPGHVLKYNGRRLVGSYLRVGMDTDGSQRMHKVRQDYSAAAKVQMEDDISVSITVPSEQLTWLGRDFKGLSQKLVVNCEYRLFQRPDDAIHRGVDRQTELDMSGSDNFFSNYQPLTSADAREMVSDTISFSLYTDPMKELILSVANDSEDQYFVAPSNPRIVEGKPTKNPRYLQVRPDIVNSRETYLAQVGLRLRRQIPADRPIVYPVDAVLPGRRNNPPDAAAGVRPLCCYNPIHFQELPELFMDFVCSLTGKSPSTTGAGSEGALTKGPFNAINTTADLNNALVSFILSGHQGMTTAAGFVGPNYRVDHDISLLIPEVFARLQPEERDPQFLISQDCFEKLEDFEYNGRTVLASRLGYRMTRNFLRLYFGRVFDSPTRIFPDEMLKPELQSMEVYVDSIDNMAEAQQRVAQNYLDDGSIKAACPPLKALLEIMATGTSEGRTAADPEFRALFTRESLLASDWYKERLDIKQQRDVALWGRHVKSLEAFLEREHYNEVAETLHITVKLERAREMHQYTAGSAYRESLVGTIGADPIFKG